MRQPRLRGGRGLGHLPGRLPADIACGNGVCEPGETVFSCLADCALGTCGNHVCEPGEENGGCDVDCFLDLCGNGVCELSESTASCEVDCPATRQADVLFVIDSSGSMAEEQARIAEQFPSLYAAIRSALHEMPDLHVGVVTTDLGTGQFPITYCSQGGDAGALVPLRGDGGAPAQPYLVDVTPVGCGEVRDATGTCTAHACGADACAAEPGTTVVIDDETGCPRCRNVAARPVDVFQATAQVGNTGCGFEQPLEAMVRALDGNPANAGFLRPDALLAVIVLTDEDDCSAKDDTLFDTTQSDPGSPLGPLTSFRCFEFGVTCDVNDRITMGERHACQPRSDAGALLHPVQRYVDFLTALKDPGRIAVTVIGGPVTDYTVTVGPSEYDGPELQPSCESQSGSAYPAVRLQSFAAHFNPPSGMSDSFVSICADSYADALQSTGQLLEKRLTFR